MSVANDQSMNLTSGYSTELQNQYQLPKRPSPMQQTYHEPVPSVNMSCVAKQNPMLGDDNSWRYSRRSGSFAEFVNTRNTLKEFSSNSTIESKLMSYPPAFSLAQQQILFQGSTLGNSDSHIINRASSGTIHGSYTTPGTSIDPLALAYTNAPTTSADTSTKSFWWSGLTGSNGDQYQNVGIPASYHNLLQANDEHRSQQCVEMRDTINSWAPQNQPAGPITISPTSLTLPIQTAPLSSSVSSQDSLHLLISPSPTPSSTVSSDDELSDYLPYKNMNIIVPERALDRARQVLLNNSESIKFSHPLSNGIALDSVANRRRSLRSSNVSRRAQASSPSSSTETSFPNSMIKKESTPPHPSRLKRLEPKPESPCPQETWTESPQTTETIQAMHNRDSKDDFLIKSKLAGMPYKEIRRQGNFTEAESTLRGRFRTLTKHKTARVRKPEWSDNDVCIASVNG